jgi:hypothetical protein
MQVTGLLHAPAVLVLGNNLVTQQMEGWMGPQIRDWRHRKEKGLLTLMRMEAQVVQPVALSL